MEMEPLLVWPIIFLEQFLVELLWMATRMVETGMLTRLLTQWEHTMLSPPLLTSTVSDD